MQAFRGVCEDVVQTGRMHTELVSEPGDSSCPNEDFASVGLPASGQGGSLVVLDGVTPPRSATGCLHSVPWFTARLGGALTELTVSLPDVPLAEALSRAISRTAAAHAGTCDLSHPRTPQATVAVARWSGDAVEYLVLSDCALLLQAPDGTVTPVLDDRLARLPRALLASDAIVDTRVRNKEGGFFTAAADPAVAERAVTGSLPGTGSARWPGCRTARRAGRRCSARATGRTCSPWSATRAPAPWCGGCGNGSGPTGTAAPSWAAARPTTTPRWCSPGCDADSRGEDDRCGLRAVGAGGARPDGRQGPWPGRYFSMTRFSWCSRRASSATSRRSQWASWLT